jgi:hypothetical protein
MLEERFCKGLVMVGLVLILFLSTWVGVTPSHNSVRNCLAPTLRNGEVAADVGLGRSNGDGKIRSVGRSVTITNGT